MEAKVQMAIAVPDEEFNRLKAETKKHGKKGYWCNDKNGVSHFFFFENKVLKGQKLVDDKWENFEVMSMTEALKKKKEMEERNPFKDYVKEKMKNDNPSWTEEEIDAKADVVIEANETIKRLISFGIAPDVAHKIVAGVIHSEEVQDHVLAELQKKENNLTN